MRRVYNQYLRVLIPVIACLVALAAFRLARYTHSSAADPGVSGPGTDPYALNNDAYAIGFPQGARAPRRELGAKDLERMLDLLERAVRYSGTNKVPKTAEGYVFSVDAVTETIVQYPFRRAKSGTDADLFVLITLNINNVREALKALNRQNLTAASTTIHDVAKAGDLNNVKTLLKDNPQSVFSKDWDGQTPLHIAAANGHKDIEELLLSAKADVLDKDYNGQTALHYAAAKGFSDVAGSLVAHGAKVNARNYDGCMPLHLAAAKGNKDVAKLLLASGSDANAKDNGGYTPLHFAAQGGFKEVVELLLANQATLNPRNWPGNTPLHLAVAQHHEEVAELLRQRGARD